MDIKQKFKNIIDFLKAPIAFKVSRGFYYYILMLILMTILSYTSGFFVSVISIVIFFAVFYFDQELIKRKEANKDE